MPRQCLARLRREALGRSRMAGKSLDRLERTRTMKASQLVGKLAIRTAPARHPDGQSDYSYSNIDPVTGQPGRYVKRCLLIEKVEPGKIIGKRVSLVSGERRDQTLGGEEWLDDAWAFVHRDGRVDADSAEETVSPVTKRFITSSPTSQAAAPRAAALLAQGAELTVAGDEVKARAVLNEALAMCKANSDLVGHGNALRAIGFLDGVAGHYDKARVCMADALALFRRGNHKPQEAYALMGLGNIEKALGKNDTAKQRFREAAAIYQSLGMTADMEMALANVGWVKCDRPGT